MLRLGERAGRVFEQNGMSIVDVDFCNAQILDTQISTSLTQAQHEALRMDLELKSKQRELESFIEAERLKRTKSEAMEETAAKAMELNLIATERAHRFNMVKLDAVESETDKKHSGECHHQELLDDINKSVLARAKTNDDRQEEIIRGNLDRKIEELNAQTTAEERRIGAVTPDLISAMTVLGKSELAAKLTKELSPLAILGGESVADVAARLLGGLGLDKALGALSQVPIKKNDNF